MGLAGLAGVEKLESIEVCLLFLFLIAKDTSEDGSLVWPGLKGGRVGRKMFKLFRRRLSDMADYVVTY